MPTTRRPAIPRPLEREVLVEAGYRCAIPACRQHPVDIAHIVPWEKVREHSFENLIALCPNDHRLADRGEIDRKALLAYKQNLGILTSRYGEFERRLLDELVEEGATVVTCSLPMDFELMYLLRDGLIEKVDTPEMPVMSMGDFSYGPTAYQLTQAGVDFLHRWAGGQPVEG